MIYFLQDSGKLYIKAGHTDKDSPEERRKACQTGNGDVLIPLCFVSDGTWDEEQALHKRFAKSRRVGEWFDPTPELLKCIIESQVEEAKREAAKKEAEAKAKSTTLPWPMTIYLAGKIAKNGWRGSIVSERFLKYQKANCPKDNEINHPCMADDFFDELPDQWPVAEKAVFATHRYCGPYFISCAGRFRGFCNSCHTELKGNSHETYVCKNCNTTTCRQRRLRGGGGCYHGDNQHGNGAQYGVIDGKHGYTVAGDDAVRSAIARLCLQAIHAADVVFAWIDSTDCYGTIAELGYAKALNKTIWIAGPRQHADMWFVNSFCHYDIADFGDELAPAAALRRMLARHEPKQESRQ